MPDVSFYSFSSLLAATPFASSLWSLTVELLPLIRAVGQGIVAFRTEPIAPAATHAFEIELQRLLREIGRVIVQWVFNRLGPGASRPRPLWFNFEGNLYRRRERSPRRLVLAPLFGTITLERIRYEPSRWWSGFALGFSAGDAFRHRRRQSDPWLGGAGRRVDRSIHARDCAATGYRGASDRVSVTTLRKVAAASQQAAWAPLTLPAPQVECLLGLFRKKAHASKGAASSGFVGGPRRDIRTGIFQGHQYREAGTATVAVLIEVGSGWARCIWVRCPNPAKGRCLSN